MCRHRYVCSQTSCFSEYLFTVLGQGLLLLMSYRYPPRMSWHRYSLSGFSSGELYGGRLESGGIGLVGMVSRGPQCSCLIRYRGYGRRSYQDGLLDRVSFWILHQSTAFLSMWPSCRTGKHSYSQKVLPFCNWICLSIAMVKLVHSPTLIILVPKLPQHLPLTKIKATIIFLQIPSQKTKYFSSLTHFTQIRTPPSSKFKICLLFLLCILMLYRAWICIRRNRLLQGTWRSLFGVNMFPVFIVEWQDELLMWVVFGREMNYSEEGVCIIISLSIPQVIIEYFQIFTQPFNMLQYRQFLNQSRTVRNSRPTGSGPSNRNINIEDLVSKPGYGEIFYSEDHKQPLVQQDPNVEVKSQHSKDNLNLRDSLQKEKNLNREMVSYMEELEEENQLLKRKLMEVLGKAENSQVYTPNDLNINGRLSEEYEGSNTISRNLTSGAIPTQHRPPSPVTDPSQNSIGTPAEQVPTFPLNSGSFRPTKLSRGGEQEEYVARRPVQSMPLPYQSAPMQAQVYADVSQPVRGRVYNRSNEESELMHLAMAKFEEIKDQDEQLRLFTLRLLKKQR